MKFNFRKIASVLAGAVMLSSTAGFAFAANYPAPFVQSGAADGAVVVTSGSHTGSTVDWDAAVDLKTALNALVTVTGSTSTATGGDSLKLEKSTNKLDMNDNLVDVWTTKITDENLPNLLAAGTFRSKDNLDYPYEQYIELSPAKINSLNWTHFSDNDYKDKTPSLGIKVDRNKYVLNYTLDFLKYPRSDVTGSGASAKLEDIEDRDISILGKTYKLLQAYNKSTNTKLVLMRGALTDTINLNEEKTEKLDTKTYTVTLVFIDSDEVQFDVVDSKGTTQRTTKLLKGGTYKLTDGSQLGVTDLSYQAFAGGVMSAEFTLGANKMVIQQGAVLSLDDENEDEINGYITRSEVSSSQVDLKKIILEWKTSDKQFITEDSAMTMPGLGSVKFSAGKFTVPGEETVKVDTDGSFGIDMIIPIKDGDAKVTILYGNATDFKWIADDNDGTGRLRTSNKGAGGDIKFDLDTDEYFFATWNDTKEGESYLLDVSDITEDTSVHRNYTSLKNVVTGTTIATQKKQGDKITIGDIELTVNLINKNNKEVNFSINGGGSFNHVLTKTGMYIWLPYNSSVDGERPGGLKKGVVFNDSPTKAAAAPTWSNPNFRLNFAEEDKDGNLGSGALFNMTLGHTSSKAEVTAVNEPVRVGGWSAAGLKEIGDTEVYEGYIASDLATKVLYKQPSGSQDTAEVTYHGGESYANVFVTAVGVTISGSADQILVVKDTEISSAQSKNLVVVGGSCINSVAAKVLGVTYPTCGADFATATKVDGSTSAQYIIKAVASPYNSAKTAVLVAGYEAAGTKAAALKLKEGVATSVGTTIVGPTVT